MRTTTRWGHIQESQRGRKSGHRRWTSHTPRPPLLTAVTMSRRCPGCIFSPLVWVLLAAAMALLAAGIVFSATRSEQVAVLVAKRGATRESHPVGRRRGGRPSCIAIGRLSK